MSVELLLALLLMALLFLRQISILKQPNKINYAPLMLGIGIIGGVIHFILQPQDADFVLVFKESLIPLLISILLYIMINIFHQTQQNELSKMQNEFSVELIKQIKELKEFALELEKKMLLSQGIDKIAQEESRERFKQDIKILDAIQANQTKILDKFELVDKWHKDVTSAFKNFTEVQLPSLDDIVHKHIDMLRIEEQDHFNKVKLTIQKALESKIELKDEIEAIKESMHNISKISQNIANAIVNHTTKELVTVTDSFEKQMRLVASHTQNIDTTLYESENRLSNIKENSELIMRQMVLSSKKMNELEKQSGDLQDMGRNIRELLEDIEAIKSEYVKAQAQLSLIVKDFAETKAKEEQNIKNEMHYLAQRVVDKLDESLEKIDKHNMSVAEDISQNVKILAKKSQFKSTYLDLES